MELLLPESPGPCCRRPPAVRWSRAGPSPCPSVLRAITGRRALSCRPRRPPPRIAVPSSRHRSALRCGKFGSTVIVQTTRTRSVAKMSRFAETDCNPHRGHRRLDTADMSVPAVEPLLECARNPGRLVAFGDRVRIGGERTSVEIGDRRGARVRDELAHTPHSCGSCAASRRGPAGHGASRRARRRSRRGGYEC